MVISALFVERTFDVKKRINVLLFIEQRLRRLSILPCKRIFRVQKTIALYSEGSKRYCPSLSAFSHCLVIIVLFLFTGCSGLSPRRVEQDRFSYNEALAQSTQNQMMLNLVRIRYFEEPIFSSVGSILTQYVYNANAGLGTIIGIGGGTDIASMNANIGYEERPTITYMPIEGRNFAVRMLSSIPAETVFAAAKQGWL